MRSIPAWHRLRAEVVVGFGGYVAVPAYLAARRQGPPIVMHEANARPGVANRLVARMTTHVFTAAPSVRLAHATAIGIPLPPAINAAVSGAAAALRAASVQVLHITGPQNVVEVPDGDPADRPTSSSPTSARCTTPTPRPTS